MSKSYLVNTQLSEPEMVEHFHAFLERRTRDMRDYVNACMKNDGDTEAESQRICMLNAIDHLDAYITGTTIDDLKLTGED